MESLKIELTVVGDLITAISEAHRIAKAIKKTPHLLIPKQNIWLLIDPEKDIQSLIIMAKLEIENKELRDEIKLLREEQKLNKPI